MHLKNDSWHVESFTRIQMNGVNGWQVLQYSEYDLESHEGSAECA